MEKKCPNCGQIWPSLEDFMRDSNLYLVGYQSNFIKIEEGFYLFNHKANNCNTSFTVPVKEFLHLYSGPRYEQSLQGTKGCENHCINPLDIEPCFQECKYRYVREIMKLFNREKK